jgi:uncharacterized protein YqhQ
MPVLESGEETLVGGQAVMEGVMMRAPHSYCVAVRKKNGEIVTQEQPLPKMAELYKIFRYPIFRGMGTLYQAMKLGLQALKFSGDVGMQDIQEAEAKEGKARPTKPGRQGSNGQGSNGQASKGLPGWVLAANMVLSLGMFVFMYKFIPLFLATSLKKVYPVFEGRIAFNLADGVIRMLIFLVFMYVLSLMKDIRRVFEFHGAEHKVVFNFESGQPVTVPNAQRFTTFHPRCGTSFLFVVIIVSIVFYTFIPFDGFLAKLLSRIALLPLIAGVSYELIRFAAKRRGSVLASITAPGLWLQRITTKPPSDDQTAVAIRALEGAMALEESQGGQLVIA